MVELQLPKLVTRVRFPSPALYFPSENLEVLILIRGFYCEDSDLGCSEPGGDAFQRKMKVIWRGFFRLKPGESEQL